MDSDILKEVIQKCNTPVYVFDINVLKERIKYLRSKLPKKVELCYAIKANTFVVKEMEDIIDRFEVCSPGEYQICKEKDVNLAKVLISGVYKTPDVIENMAIEDGIQNFTIESMEQFELLKNISLKTKLKALIRITSGNQFGINIEEAEEIIKNREKYQNLDIIGIQYFSGTQKKSIKNLNKELEFINNFIKTLKEKYDYSAKELEFGPGFPFQYFQNEEFDEETFLKEFAELIDNLDFEGQIILELGRSIVASCGSYITKVVDKKTNKNQNYAILDGGIHHLVYFGQSMAMKLPICETYPKRKDCNEKWNLCGSLCTVNDILVKQFPAGDLQIGDLFIFKNTGAYCVTEGISLFLSRDLPTVLKIIDNKVEIARESLPTYHLNK